MSGLYEKAFFDYLTQMCENAGIRFSQAPEYLKHQRLYDGGQEKLLELISEKDRRQAQRYLEDIAYGKSLEIDYYYRQGVMDGIRTLKLLGAL